jgi:two-component system, NarL family, nitrate/nitrite response regulator NarL
MNIRIVVADDHPIFRAGLARSIAESGAFEVVGEAGSADEAVAQVAALSPDLVLLDISMPGGGIAAAARIAARFPGVRIAMLTASEADHDVMAAMKAGAIGYVLKGVSGSELLEVLREVAAGRAHVPPALAARVLAALKAPGALREGIEDLTQREEDILRRVAKGLSNRETATELGLQEKTVKHYMTIILEKLQARNRVEAALIAREKWGG